MASCKCLFSSFLSCFVTSQISCSKLWSRLQIRYCKRLTIQHLRHLPHQLLLVYSRLTKKCLILESASLIWIARHRWKRLSLSTKIIRRRVVKLCESIWMLLKKESERLKLQRRQDNNVLLPVNLTEISPLSRAWETLCKVSNQSLKCRNRT